MLRALAQRPREADPGYDLPAASSLSDADAFLQVRPFLRLLALLCGQVRPVPLPGVRPVLPAPGTPDRDRAAVRLRPLERPGGPWRDGRWHGLRVLAKDGTVRVVADPKGADRKGERREVPQRRALRPAGQHRRPRRPAGPHGGGHRRLGTQLRGVGSRAVPHRGDHPRRLPRARLRAGRPGPGRPRVPQQPGRRHQDRPPGSTSPGGSPRRGNCAAAGRPLADGTWKTAITWQGRTVKVRVIEYHMDQVFDLPPGHPLLAAPPAGVSVRVLDDSDGPPGGMCRQPATARSASRCPRPSPSSPA